MTLTMDSPRLRALPRIQLQSLAKREFIRAVGKTEDIIRRLIQKHPKGVPIPEEVDNPSVSSAPLQQDLVKQSSENAPSHSPARGTSKDRTDPKGKGKAVAEATSPSPSPSSSTEALELLYPDDEYVADPPDEIPESVSVSHLAVAESEGPPEHPIPVSGEPSPVEPSKRPSHQADNEGKDAQESVASPADSNPGWQADEEDEVDEVYNNVDYPKGAPNHYMVIDALRKFTTLVNSIPSMEARIAEGRCLLKRTETQLEKVMPDARELTVTREYLETFLLARMKEKRELWDGTAKMEKSDRKLRMEWLRAERKAENERKWKETNKLYEEHGLQPVPFSVFASQSDEETIESLQTTPTSCGSGSSKRIREESADGESDGDSDTDDESRRKRARA